MKIKVHVKTVEGSAPRVILLFQKYVIGMNRRGITHLEAFGDESNIFIEIEGTPKKCFAVSKNLNRFDSVVKMVFQNKKVQNILHLDTEEIKTLNDLFQNHTSIEVIKEATAQEMEEDNKSFWQKLKEKYKKKFKV